MSFIQYSPFNCAIKEKNHCNKFSPVFFPPPPPFFSIPHKRRMLHLAILYLLLSRSRLAGNKTSYSAWPPSPGNYPNLPSSSSPAPVCHAGSDHLGGFIISAWDITNGLALSLCRQLERLVKRNRGERRRRRQRMRGREGGWRGEEIRYSPEERRGWHWRLMSQSFGTMLALAAQMLMRLGGVTISRR